MLISKQSKALDVISWELPFKETALVFPFSTQGRREIEVLETNTKVSLKLWNRILLTLMFKALRIIVSFHVLSRNIEFCFWGEEKILLKAEV